MPGSRPSFEESVRTAHRRGDVILALAALREAHASRLAEVCGMTTSRLWMIMYGRLPYYRPDRSPIALGLAREIRRPRGRVFVITDSGAQRARELEVERRAKARESRAQHARLKARKPDARRGQGGQRSR